MKKTLLSAVICAAMMLLMVPVHAAMHLVWFTDTNGKQFWYENDQRQGVPGDPKNIWDTTYGLERGREIYDPGSDAWYWLDSIYGGAKAMDKEVWMPYIYQSDMAAGINKQGKWVRYNSNGAMIKGWYTPVGNDEKLYPEQRDNLYYYDLITGEMVKGYKNINGKTYHFDEVTGVLDTTKGDDYSFPFGMQEFLQQFLFGYGRLNGEMAYSASNPLVNTNQTAVNVIKDFFPCVDYSVGPLSYNFEHLSGTDPLGWFSSTEGYLRFDADKVDWLREHVLNMSAFDFNREVYDAEMSGILYRQDYGDNHAYYRAFYPQGLEGMIAEVELGSFRLAGDIYVVDFVTRGWHWNNEIGDWEQNAGVSGKYRAFLWQKSFNSSPYWSIIANRATAKG